MRVLAAIATMTVLGASVISCSDPVPPTPQGAVSFHFTNSLNQACAVSQFDSAIGAVNGATKTSVEDGANGNQVKCSVTPSGGSFSVVATISGNDPTLKGTTTLSIQTNAPIAPGGEADATVNVATDATKTSYFSTVDKPCKISLKQETDEKGLAVTDGRIWAKFMCESLVEKNAGSTCAIRGRENTLSWGGYFVFENCEQLAPSGS